MLRHKCSIQELKVFYHYWSKGFDAEKTSKAVYLSAATVRTIICGLSKKFKESPFIREHYAERTKVIGLSITGTILLDKTKKLLEVSGDIYEL